MRINFVFPMVWSTAVCRTLHAFSNECYYKACQVKKNLCCLPDLLVAILSLFQHNNRMQNSRIFLVFLLSFLSFFLSFVFFLKAGRGGGGRSWMWNGFKRAWIIARYYVCLSPELKVFIVLLEIEIQCDREIVTTNGNLNKYRNKWTTLCISD